MTGKSLLERCLEDEQVGWTEFYNSYVRAVYRWSLFFGVDKNEAEELVQEVFSTAMKKVGCCNSDQQIPAWLFQITRRHAANHRRKAWFKRVIRRNNPYDDDKGFVGIGTAGKNPIELSFDLQRMMSRLPIALAEILIMHDLDGYTRKEIAQILNLPEGTVASRLSSARATLRQAWG